MNSLAILAIGVGILLIGYLFYGRWLSKEWC